MMNRATILSLAVLCFSLLSVTLSAQETVWEKYMGDAQKAYEQALYGEAEQLYLAALKETEPFEDEDGRLATSLSKLAALYFTQGKYAQLELLYQRVLAIRERAFGVHHPSVVQTLESYADLLWKQNRETEAKNIEARYKEIRRTIDEPPPRLGGGSKFLEAW